MHGLSCVGFHENHKCLIASFAYYWYRISVELENDCSKYKLKFIYASSTSTALIEPFFKETHSDLTLRQLMSHIYGAPILDVSRSHTTTQHSR